MFLFKKNNKIDLFYFAMSNDMTITNRIQLHAAPSPNRTLSGAAEEKSMKASVAIATATKSGVSKAKTRIETWQFLQTLAGTKKIF